MNIDETIGRVKNPLAMVAIFAALSELAMAYVIINLPERLQVIFIWFVMGFPAGLVLAFFFVLYKKPAVFFSPGDYKKEELYVTSIGINGIEKEYDGRIRIIEEKISAIQNFIDGANLDSAAKNEYLEVNKAIQKQQDLEKNQLYKFITVDLGVDHAIAQRLIESSNDAWELSTRLETEFKDRRMASRLSSLLSSFPNAVSDFLKIKSLISTEGGRK